MAGTISGTVKDIRTGQALYGATVSVQPGDHTATTLVPFGAYSISSLDARTYDITVTEAGYEPFTAHDIPVLDDGTTEINVGLRTTG